uniref:Zinc finger, CCHC domain containing 4 n=2 Tax=Cyprinus carpio TaxID=7962 RepID=A0A9J8DJV4_CYPCA
PYMFFSGPALLFEKNVNGKEKGRRFHACSACRDRKHCNFFQWADEKISEARMLSREEQNHSKMPFFSHQEYCSRFREFVSLPLEQRRFCVDCQLLILPGESANHVKHRYICIIYYMLALLITDARRDCPVSKKYNIHYHSKVWGLFKEINTSIQRLIK